MPTSRSRSIIQIKGGFNWITIALSLAAVALGAAHTWAAVSAQSMNPDGIHYLDMGDALMRGDWQNGLSPVWSPAYALILGAVVNFVQPEMRWEFPLVQGVNFLIYLAALGSFSWFWRQAWNLRQKKVQAGGENPHTGLPYWAFFGVGYLLFIWVSLTLIELWAVTPDMLMSALVYLCAGLILRQRYAQLRWGHYLLLGFLLGLGYLVKTIMFVVAIIFLGLLVFSAEKLKTGLKRGLLAGSVFFLISFPLVFHYSSMKGHFTIGEAGRVTYLRHVNQAAFPYWEEGESTSTSAPVVRKVFENPPIYEFATPIYGSYPIGYDSSYWYQGLEPRTNLAETGRTIAANLLVMVDLFIKDLGFLSAPLVLLYLVARPAVKFSRKMIACWGLSITAGLIFLLYALVHVDGRYLGVFIVIILAEFFTNLQMPANSTIERLADVSGLVMIVGLSISLVSYNLEGITRLTIRQDVFSESSERPAPSWKGEVAQELKDMGVQPGDGVAVIGYGFDAYWARLARVKIVAEMFNWQADPYYLGDDQFQSEVIDAFRTASAKAIVAEYVPGYARLNGWNQVGQSNYFIYLIDAP